jgi:hypothetical protein
MKLLPALTRPRPQAEPAAVATPALEPIRLILPDQDLSGWIQPTPERLSDHLQTGAPLSFLPASSVDDGWIAIDPAELLLVVPPPHVSPPDRRVRRQLHEVFARVEGYVVSGTAHLMPGEEYNLYLRSTRQFLPVTGATLEGIDGPQTLDVVIVNLKQVEEFRVV